MRDIVRSALAIGPRSVAYRALWEAENRLGVRQLTQPRGIVPVPRDLPPADAWLDALQPKGWLAQLRTRSESAPPFDAGQSTSRAEAVVAGTRRLFGAVDVEVGFPAAFDREPLSGGAWPRVHWSKVLGHIDRVGDPRVTWEVHRDAFVWELVRAWSHDRDPRWPRAFAEHLAAFEAENPFRTGINWVSGQELALRSLMWLVGAAVFAGREGFSEADFRRLSRLLYWHGFHIHAERGFARRSVANNHVIAESLALAVLGEAGFGPATWADDGRPALFEAVEKQFFPDGGYCQHSHRYHRFALELLLLADRLVDAGSVLEDAMRTGLRYLEAQLVDDRHLPNYGPNDGALAFALTACPPEDVRPLLSALRVRIDGWGAPEAGAHDELAYWLFGEPAPVGPPWRRCSTTFPDSGVHVHQRRDWTVVLRAGRALPNRAGHDDQLHVEVWHAGRSIAVDGGSHSYHDEQHRWFAGACSHNVVTVNGRGPRELFGKFTWAGESEARVAEFDAERGRVVASCDAWCDVGLSHEREVRVDEAVTVVDRLGPVAARADAHEFRLHWLLDCADDDVTVDGDQECFTWNIRTPHADIVVTADEVSGTFADASLVVEPAFTSPHYATRKEATSIIARIVGPSVRFRTRFVAR